ncbi:MAG TPA: GNAT family N-acetyltransferase [Anaerolineales bacterium]|jgi:GNAT superfamily N-acetyltransferase|nr:GNAT family N-acetyltransferase [Anaerolineales bacterium]
MRIVEYDDVDPLQVLYVAKLALDFALTPEKVAHLRQSDPRLFPCLAVYAVEDDTVLGQVGIFRLPMISTAGREDVGGIWAVSTHPQYAGREVASRLLEEAHTRMREAGLRFSTLGTDRYRVAYRLYRQHGYEETNVWATALARWETAHQPTRLHAEPPGAEGYDFVEQVFMSIAKDYLGFAWRHTPFARLRRVDLTDIWILRENTDIVGYALAHADQTMLTISNIVLRPGIDPAEAVAAIAAELKSAYIQVKASRPMEISSLRRGGYHVAQPTWDGFMIKSLLPEVSIEDARQLFGIGTDRFLISWLDVT